MNKVIWKYILKETDMQTLEMPANAEILTVQMQNGNICMWALVWPDNEKEIRSFEIFGTGHPINSKIGTQRQYIATFQIPEAGLVFHVFEYTGK